MHDSDCAMHNAPAEQAGACDCSLSGRLQPDVTKAQQTTDEPYIPPLCGNCDHWSAFHNNPSFGPCRLSAKSMGSPLIVTNRSSCTQYKLARRLEAQQAGGML